MFFAWAVMSMLGYAVHNVWLAPYYRRLDTLTAVTVRGAGLSLVMLPCLALAGAEAVSQVPGQWPWLLAASVCALGGNCAAAASLRYLPIGVATALNSSLSTIVSAILSAQLLGELPSAPQFFWMAVVFAGVFGLGAAQSPGHGAAPWQWSKGLLCAVVFGLTLGTAYTFIGRISRVLSPLVTGYCWEFTITLLGSLVLLCRRGLSDHGGVLPTRRDLGWILLYCLPGGIGTACYSLAVASGPVAVVAAVLSTMMVACSVLAWLRYGERLSVRQWAWICLVCAAVVGMKVCG